MNKTGRQRQKEQTRKALLAAAFGEFGERGIMATRMSDIAAAAGVSHGTVFAHFRTQEALISAVIEEYGRQVAQRTHELADSCASVRELLAVHLQGIKEFEPFYTRLVIESRLLPQTSRNVLVSIQSAISFHFSQAVRREMQAGTIRQAPLHLLFNTWIGLVHYYLANGDLFAPGGGVLERHGELLLDFYLQLITAKSDN